MNLLVYEKRQSNVKAEVCFEKMIPEATLLTCENEDDFLQSAGCYLPDAVIVSMDGADGMEAAIAVRRQYPEVPLVWFSDDSGFAAQAYRLHTTYFHPKPITKQILKKALTSCGLAEMEEG